MLSVQPLLFDARIQKEAIALRDDGWDVHVWHVDDRALRASVPNERELQEALDKALTGIRVHSALLASRQWRQLPRVINWALQALELLIRGLAHVFRCGADIYHCHDLEPGVFGLTGRLAGARLVYDAHEVEVRSPNPVLRFVQAMYERTVVLFSDRVITVNASIAELMRRKYGRPVSVIMNQPARVPIEAQDTTLLRRQAGCPEGSPILLYVGYVHPYARGIERVIDALGLLPGISFVILGVGRLRAFREHIETYVREESPEAAGRVIFLPPVPPHLVISYTSGADCSVMLYGRDVSKDMATPNKLFESIVARVPILGTDTPLLRQYILENEVGPIGDVVDPADRNAVAAKIRKLLSADAQRTMRANAGALSSRVGWDFQARVLVDLYRQIGRLTAESAS